MAKPALDSTTTLTITRTFAAPREKVFKAWTDPQELKKWWAAGPGFTTPFAEVDLRVGGRYRLAMKPPDQDVVRVVGGVYREVRPPERLIYTWAWEGSGGPETVVTVTFTTAAATPKLSWSTSHSRTLPGAINMPTVGRVVWTT